MKFFFILFLLLFVSLSIDAQNNKLKKIVPSKRKVNRQLNEIKKRQEKLHSDSSGIQPKKNASLDTTLLNRYGDLLNDDPLYNKKYPIWKPALGVLGANLFVLAADRYLFKYDFATQVGISSWSHNINTGWEWDTDRFGINFVGHPYSGTLSFNAARSNGYNYWQSVPFAIGGSLLWEYFGENTLPSYNDIINTPINGAFLGEILYRLSSNILDDRSRGNQRFFRELTAGLINPVRGVNRLLQGKSFRKINTEVYQKEPLNVTLFGGIHIVNASRGDVNISPTEGISNPMFNVQLDYGNPFENRPRKPFDFFKLRVDLNFGVGRKILNNVAGYGILTGKNYQTKSGNRGMLLGAFQYYDYWDNKTFELGALGFGGGLITKVLIDKASKSNLYTSLHLAAVPFAGSSRQFGPDTTQVRDYDFGGGLEGKFESTINIGKRATATMVAYYYWIHNYVGMKEENFVGILRPRVTVGLFKSLSIGYEHFIYVNDRFINNLSPIHLQRTEEKIFLLIFLEDNQRRGHYN